MLDTMILVICVVVDESKCLDSPIWEFSTICEHLPFWDISGTLHQLLVLAHPGSLDMKSHDFCCCQLRCWWQLFSEYCIRPWIVFHNITSEYNSSFVFLVLCFQFGILQMTDASVKQNELLRPSSLLRSITSLLLLTFVRFHAWIFFKFLPFLIHCCLLLWGSSWLEA